MWSACGLQQVVHGFWHDIETATLGIVDGRVYLLKGDDREA